MDLRYYFVRRGSENIYEWTTETFELKSDPATGINYIEKVKDEMTKNHTETDSDIITGYMPEIPGSKMCPVMSYTTYLSALTPGNKYLWQPVKYNKFNYEQKIWYGPGRIGQNTLDSFMTKISDKVGMKDRGYTNHSLRVSGITNLSNNNFTNKQIMSISGHKSQDSLAIYQKVKTNEKLRMGLTLGYTLMNKPLQKAIAPAQIPQLPAILPAPSTAVGNAILPQNIENIEPSRKKSKIVYEEENPIPSNAVAIMDNPSEFEISDEELINMINDTASQNMELTQYNELKSTKGNSETYMKQVVQKKTSPRPPLFQNCTFSGNVTFNINK